MSLFGVPLAQPGEAVRKPRPRRPRRRRVPAQVCPACLVTFYSHNAERYCQREACTAARGSGLYEAPLLLTAGDYDPATAPWPEGF
jgi:hypothetical protein